MGFICIGEFKWTHYTSRVAVIHDGADCFAIENFSRGVDGADVARGA